MSIIFSSECLPYDPNFLQGTTFSYTTESIEPPSIAKAVYKCPNCQAYKLRKEDFCPICMPKAFSTIVDADFKYFQIETKPKKGISGPIVFVLLDLSLDIKDFNTFANFLKAESESHFYDDLMFIFVLVGKSVTFMNFLHEGQIGFSSMTSVFEPLKYLKPLLSYTKDIKKAFKIGKSILQSSQGETNCLNDFLYFITNDIRDEAYPYIQDIIYIFKDNIPKEPSIYVDLHTHLIQVTESPTQGAIDLANYLQASFNVTNSLQSKCFFDSFRKSIVKNTCKPFIIKLFHSEGLQIKDFSGPVLTLSTSKTRCNKYELSLCNDNQFPPYFIPTYEQKDLYNRNGFFSMQIAVCYFTNSIIVINNVWRKETNTKDWINVLLKKKMNKASAIFYAALYQKKACQILKTYIKTPINWSVPNRNIKCFGDKSIAKKVSELENFISSFFGNSNNFIKPAIKAYMLRELVFGNGDSIVAMFESILYSNLDENSNVLLIPPFQFVMNKIYGERDMFVVLIDNNSLHGIIQLIKTFRKKWGC